MIDFVDSRIPAVKIAYYCIIYSERTYMKTRSPYAAVMTAILITTVVGGMSSCELQKPDAPVF